MRFTAHAELRQVNPGFDREAGARQDPALFAGLQSVHVGAVAVRLLADAVAGAVAKRLAIAGGLNDLASGLIDLPALQRLLAGERSFHPFDGRVAALSDN